jgi:hypothetical protein
MRAKAYAPRGRLTSGPTRELLSAGLILGGLGRRVASREQRGRKIQTRKIDAFQFRFPQDRRPHASALKISPGNIGIPEVRSSEIRAAKHGMAEIGPKEFGPAYLGFGQIGPCQICLREIGFPQVRAA